MASLFKQTTTYDPIYAILNTQGLEARDKLTDRWRQNKLEELNFIGIVVGGHNGVQEERFIVVF